jgi:hypothetical protein
VAHRPWLTRLNRNSVYAAIVSSIEDMLVPLKSRARYWKNFPLPIGSFVPSNLTPAGALKYWSDGQTFRVIRNGVAANGRRLVVMSLTNAGSLSDDGIQSLIAYIRLTPAAAAQTPEPPDMISPLGVGMLGAGCCRVASPSWPACSRHRRGHRLRNMARTSFAIRTAANAMAMMWPAAKQDCPKGPDLNVVKGWKREQLLATRASRLRTDTDHNGHELNREQMPWQDIGKMDDTDLKALYESLGHLRGK